MSIKQTIEADLKEAMKAKDEIKLTVLRGIKSGFTNELVASGKTPQDEINDELAMNVVKRAAKQRKDAIEQFENGGRPELAENEKKELEIIEAYLPEMMSEEKVREIVKAKISELGISDKSGMGQLMGAVMSETKGQADGGFVKKVVDEELS
jgi:uncharacterized protein YqeY